MLSKIVKKYYLNTIKEKHHRYKSWEHCYKYFRNCKQLTTDEKKDLASLHLGFYLASWGMYRGSSFLLQKDYKVHQYAIEVLSKPKYNILWDIDIGEKEYENNLNLIIDLKNELCRAYFDNINFVKGEEKDINVTDTLSSKIILGTVGVIPAYDRYFIDGLDFHGFKNKNLNKKSLKELIEFYNLFSYDFVKFKELTRKDGLEYPTVKLLDMYFWQVGYILDNPYKANEYDLRIINEIRDQYKFYINKRKAVFKKNSKKNNNFTNYSIIPDGILSEVINKITISYGTIPFEYRGIKITEKLIRSTIEILNAEENKILPQNCRQVSRFETPDGLDKRLKDAMKSDLRMANIISDLLSSVGIVEVTTIENIKTGRKIKATRLIDKWTW